MPAVAGAVLAGGSSLRMGTDKAFLEVAGRAVISRPVAALAAVGASPIVMVGGDRPRATAIGLDSIADQWPGEGPLGGLVTALSWCPHPRLLLVSCDLLGLDAETLQALLDADDADEDAVMAFTDRLEPLCALWHVSRATEALHAAFASGERSVRHAVRGMRIRRVELSSWTPLLDVDSPDDLPFG